jgi:hypothetical protein
MVSAVTRFLPHLQQLISSPLYTAPNQLEADDVSTLVTLQYNYEHKCMYAKTTRHR